MTAPLAPAPRLTLADRDAILSAGIDAWVRTDIDALMRGALADWQLFKCGALVSDEGRQLVVTLLQLGYPLIPAMRIALHMEANHGQ